MPHIPSEQLTLDMIPDPETATESELWQFAHTFHAYTHWGGMEKAHTATEKAGEYQVKALARYVAEHGEEPEWFPFPEPQLDYIRTGMFLDCRAERHCNQGAIPEAHFWGGLRGDVRAIRHHLS